MKLVKRARIYHALIYVSAIINYQLQCYDIQLLEVSIIQHVCPVLTDGYGSGYIVFPVRRRKKNKAEIIKSSSKSSLRLR